VHLVEVDRVDAEALGARAAAVLHDRRDRQDREDLRGEVDLVPQVVLAQRGADDALALAEAVRLRGVDHGDAELDRAVHDAAGLAGGEVVAVPPLPRAELPRAQPDPRQPLAALHTVQVAHGISSSSDVPVSTFSRDGRRREKGPEG